MAADGPSILPQLFVRRGREPVTLYDAAFGAVADCRVGETERR